MVFPPWRASSLLERVFYKLNLLIFLSASQTRILVQAKNAQKFHGFLCLWTPLLFLCRLDPTRPRQRSGSSVTSSRAVPLSAVISKSLISTYYCQLLNTKYRAVSYGKKGYFLQSGKINCKIIELSSYMYLKTHGSALLAWLTTLSWRKLAHAVLCRGGCPALICPVLSCPYLSCPFVSSCVILFTK